MRCSSRRCFLTFTGVAILWLVITLRVPEETEDGQNEARYGRKKSSESLEEWQNITFKYLEKIQQRRKTLLTVGITSVPQQDRESLLYTLASLYNGSSAAEQKRLTVLIHLANSDFTWLTETIAQISHLYSSQISAGQLLLIHAPPDAYPTVDGVQKLSYQEQVYSKQNVDHAFLMSFASKLSTYFLLIEDSVYCTPHFISHIHAKVRTMKPNTWVLLEFSNMGFLGKLFHSKDLPLLAHFLLLFHKERPLDRMILHFRTLLAQKDPILYRPFLFYHRLPHSTFEDEKPITAQKKNPYGPTVLPGSVITDMKVSDAHFPWEAYTLDESFFWTYNVSVGNHLTVILNHPANLNRVQVRTGSLVDGKYILEKGQVELGYDPEGMPQHCTSFALLGRLVQGQMDQEIFLKSMGKQVSCLRVVVNADQTGGLMIRHIYLWEETAKKEAELT